MRRFVLPLMTVALIGFAAGSASAQCDFNARKSQRFQSGMIRTFVGCPSSWPLTLVKHPNNATSTGLPACSPVIAKPAQVFVWRYYYYSYPEYEFNDNGACTVKITGKVLTDCSKLRSSDGASLGLPPQPCYDNTIQLKCKGIVHRDGTTLIDGTRDDGWVLAIQTKVSLNDSVSGDMTPVPARVEYLLPTPKKGRIKAKFSATEQSVVPLGLGAMLPPCTVTAILSIRLKSPAGGVDGTAGEPGIHQFAELGNSGEKRPGFGFGS